MKKIFNIILAVLIFSAPHAFAADKSCTDMFSEFDNSRIILTDNQRTKLDTCTAFCDQTSSLPDAKKTCGIDECRLQMASDGKVSPWCCFIAKSWQNKEGAATNPLAPLVAQCKKQAAAEEPQSYISCVNSYNNTNSVPDSCCTNTALIRRYDFATGTKIINYCSQKRSAQVCRSQISKGVYSNACCAYARENGNKITGTPFFRDDVNLASFIESGLQSCVDNEKVQEEEAQPTAEQIEKGSDKAIPLTEEQVFRNREIKALDSCRDNFKVTGQINPSCCIAFYDGVLIPTAEKMNYSKLDQYCFPQNYRSKIIEQSKTVGSSKAK